MDKNDTSTNPSFLQKTIFVKDLKNNEEVQTSFLVKSKQILSSKNGKPYILLQLADSSGVIDTRIWNDIEELSFSFEEGDIVAISGKTHTYHNHLQLVVDQLIKIPKKEVKLEYYYPKVIDNLDYLFQEFQTKLLNLENHYLKHLSENILKNDEISSKFRVCPGGRTIHHAYIGGLLFHSLQLIKLVEATINYYKEINRSIAIFGAAFHDIGKIFELQNDFSYSDEGKLLGHISIGLSIIDKNLVNIPDFPKELELQIKHIILSHHGSKEFGSPIEPQTIEALLIHHLDKMDSEMDSVCSLFETMNMGSNWTSISKHHERSFLKPQNFC